MNFGIIFFSFISVKKKKLGLLSILSFIIFITIMIFNVENSYNSVLVYQTVWMFILFRYTDYSSAKIIFAVMLLYYITISYSTIGTSVFSKDIRISRYEHSLNNLEKLQRIAYDKEKKYFSFSNMPDTLKDTQEYKLAYSINYYHEITKYIVTENVKDSTYSYIVKPERFARFPGNIFINYTVYKLQNDTLSYGTINKSENIEKYKDWINLKVYK